MHRRVQLHVIRILTLTSAAVLLYACAHRKGDLETSLFGLLPKQGELSGVRLASEPRFFGPDNLFKYIDGAADAYLLYGFRKVITTEYAVGADSSSVNVEIYCMESPTHAFGIYAAERSPEEQPVAIGVEGYQDADVLNFYKGPYYVKMVSFADSKDVSASLAQIGRSIAGKIPGGFKKPEMFRYFPVENKVKQSERYIPTDFLGQSYLENGYLCDYASDQETYQIFLVPLESDTAAQTVLRKYRDFLKSQDYRIVDQGENNVMIAEKGDFILAFAFRSYFGGVLNTKNQKQGLATIEETIKSLPR